MAWLYPEHQKLLNNRSGVALTLGFTTYLAQLSLPDLLHLLINTEVAELHLRRHMGVDEVKYQKEKEQMAAEKARQERRDAHKNNEPL